MAAELQCKKCKQRLRPDQFVTPIHRVRPDSKWDDQRVAHTPDAWQHLECPAPKKTGHRAPEGWCRVPKGTPHVDCEIVAE